MHMLVHTSLLISRVLCVWLCMHMLVHTSLCLCVCLYVRACLIGHGIWWFTWYLSRICVCELKKSAYTSNHQNHDQCPAVVLKTHLVEHEPTPASLAGRQLSSSPGLAIRIVTVRIVTVIIVAIRIVIVIPPVSVQRNPSEREVANPSAPARNLKVC